ncbi:MAG: helix-turn-helix domain-containing protein [Anaerolineales bacterium]|nr:helix-turn-helix domain-containing protein [Anaerolineales bacterium]
MKIDEVARLLRVNPRTVYRRVWKGDLQAAKVGGLYYIRRSDLQAMLDQGRGLQTTEEGRSAGVLKCGACYRILENDTQIAQTCVADGCDQLICTDCHARGIETCNQHSPSREQRMAEAQQRLERQEISLLLTDAAARLSEMNFINRIQARLEQVNSLLHPITGELVDISSWDELLDQGDERATIMRLRNRVILDTATLQETPLNAYLRYHIPAGKYPKGQPLEIRIQVLNHLETMLRDGFDTQPFRAEELIPWLVRISDEAQRDGMPRLAVLAASTGWASDARQIIQGGGEGSLKASAFMHRSVFFYLFDMHNGDLLFNLKDDRARRYAELFTPALPSEELEEIIAAIDRYLLRYGSLALEFASQVFAYSPKRLADAFESMGERPQYLVTDVPGLGKVIVPKL